MRKLNTTPHQEPKMPKIETTEAGKDASPFAKKNGKKNTESSEGITMTENTEAINEVVAQKNTVSIADLYSEMEKEITLRGDASAKNVGVTARIKEIVDSIFEATQKEKLLLSAVVKIVEKQEDRRKLYNLVRSIANSKSSHAKYGLETIDGRTYIVRK